MTNVTVQEALRAAEKLIVKAIMFESEAEQYLSESNYELNGCLGDSAADISVNGKAVLAKVRAALAEVEASSTGISNNAIEKRKEQDKLAGWVSVEDRLPENYSECWVLNGSGNVYYAKRDINHTFGWDCINGVTHWMPCIKPSAPTDTE